MRERPILFSGPMVRALLDGRKTQTRRIIKPAPDWEHPEPMSSTTAEGWQGPLDHAVWSDNADPEADVRRCPYGGPGDRLWVRETWCEADTPSGYDYAARFTQDTRGWGWRPSIHMPRKASRLTLLITDVRVERLQDISEADAIAEGLYRSTPDAADLDWFSEYHEERVGRPPSEAELADFTAGTWMAPGVPQGWGLTREQRQRDQWAPTARFAYQLVWNHINGKGAWDANPWVWALTFQAEAAQP